MGRTFILILILLALGTSARGQSLVPANRNDTLRYLGISAAGWHQQLPLTLQDNLIPIYHWAGIQARGEGGGFRRPQAPDHSETVEFTSASVRKIRDWRVAGTFQIAQRWNHNQKYSMVADPFTGNPFVLADTIAGNWRGQNLAVSVNALSPAIRPWLAAGLALTYQVGQAARQADPRPLYRYRELSLRPEIVLHLWPGITVAPRLVLESYLEENEVGFFAPEQATILLLRGLGTASVVPIQSFTRTDRGASYGGGLSARWRVREGYWLLTGDFLVREHRLRDGIAQPQDGGQYSSEQRWAEVWNVRENQHRRREYLLRIKNQTGRAIDPAFQAVNYRFAQNQFIAGMRVFRLRTKGTDQWTVDLAYASQDHRNIVAITDWRVNTLSIRAGGERSWIVSPHWTLRLHGELGYTQAYNAAYRALNPSAVTDQIVQPDYAYFAESPGLFGLQAMIDRKCHQSGLLSQWLIYFRQQQVPGTANTFTRMGTSVNFTF